MKNLFRNIFLVSCLLLTVGAVEAQAQTAQKASLEQLKAKYEQLAPGSPESKEAKAQYKKALMEQQNALPDGSTRNQQGDVERSAGTKTQVKDAQTPRQQAKTNQGVVQYSRTDKSTPRNYNVVIAQPGGGYAAKQLNPNLPTKIAKTMDEYQNLLNNNTNTVPSVD